MKAFSPRQIVYSALLFVAGCVTSPLAEDPFIAFTDPPGQILLVHQDAELPNLGVLQVQPSAKTVWDVSLTTGAAKVVRDDIAAFSADIIANENWIAWLDRTDASLWAFDRKSGVTKDIPGSVIPTGTIPTNGTRLLALNGNQLVLHTPINPLVGECYDFLLIDLAAEKTQVVADAWSYGDFATDGAHFAYADCGTSNVELLGLELRTNIRVADLSTGDVAVVRPDVRVSGAGGTLLFQFGGGVYWEEFDNGSFRSHVRQYDLAAAKLSNLFDNFDTNEKNRELLGVGNGFAVVRTHGTGGVLDFSKPGQLEIWYFNGKRTLLQESLALQQQINISVRIVGDTVVWFDPSGKTEQYVAYDTGSGATRHIATPQK